MQIKTRKEAAAASENTYFTGKICKNGHCDYRYVRSGACRSCVRENMTNHILSKNQNIDRAENERRRQIIEVNFQLTKVRVFIQDQEELTTLAYGLAAMRMPGLRIEDMETGKRPFDLKQGACMCYFYCHAQDVALFIKEAGARFSARLMPADIIRENVLNKVLGAIEIPAAPGEPGY